jgi:hypothetical protein
MEMTFKEIAALRRHLIPMVHLLQEERRWAKESAAKEWELASPTSSLGGVAFELLNSARDDYRKSTADLAVVEGILAKCKREERRLQKRNSLNMEWERLYLRMREINEQLDQS